MKAIGADALLIAIRKHCLDCSGGNRGLVERCGIKHCALFPYRSIHAIGGERETVLKGQITMFEKGVKCNERGGGL